MITTHMDRGMRRLFQQVAECIDREPPPDVYCDACLALHMQVSLAEATEATVHVAGATRLQRRRSQCAGCLRLAKVTSRSQPVSSRTPIG